MSLVKKAAVAVLVGPHGRGSNMVALAKACEDESYPAEIAVVVAPKPAPALELAAELGLNTQIVPYGEDFDARLVEELAEIDWLCVAGFLRMVPEAVLHHLGGRVLNIHPSLLPRHGGKGMYGRFVHEAVLAAHDTESGCTVHFVNDEYDDGAIVEQRRCAVLPDDTSESLAARVLELEHLAYPSALRKAIDAKSR